MPIGMGEELTLGLHLSLIHLYHSSELLLNLVNDVLDLSRLESGKIKFSVKPNDLVACCQRALDSIRHRVKPGVRLTFTPSIESVSYTHLANDYFHYEYRKGWSL